MKVSGSVSFAFRFSAFLCCLILVAACQKESEKVGKDVLAKIDNYEVTEAHFKSAFKRYYYKSGQALTPSFQTKKSILDTEFNRYVLATYAEDLGIHERREAEIKKEMIRRKVLTEEYLEQGVLSKVNVTEEEIRDMFVRFNTRLRASHLYAPDRSTAYQLYRQIQNGATFEELAKSVFQNEKLAESGGDLGEFSVDEMDVAFERTAFEMEVGEISKPVRTAQGYSIIKLTDRFKSPILTEYQYASKKDQFAYFAQKQKEEMTSREHMYTFVDNLTFNEEKLQLLWDYYSKNYSAFISGEPELFEAAFDDEEVIAEGQGFELTLGDLKREIKVTPTQNLNRVSGMGTFKNLVTGIAYRGFLLQGAENLGLDQDERVQSSINQSYYVYLAQQAEEYLRQSISVTDDELLQTYYKERDRFKKPLEANFSRIIVTSEETANKVLEEYNAGAEFSALVEKYTIDNIERLRSGVLGYDNVQNYGFLSPQLSRLEVGEVSEPLFYQTGVYHIYKCLGKKEARPLGFQEAKTRVEKYLKDQKLKALKAETIKEVKAKHGAVVDQEKLRELSIQI